MILLGVIYYVFAKPDFGGLQLRTKVSCLPLEHYRSLIYLPHMMETLSFFFFSLFFFSMVPLKFLMSLDGQPQPTVAQASVYRGAILLDSC